MRMDPLIELILRLWPDLPFVVGDGWPAVKPMLAGHLARYDDDGKLLGHDFLCMQFDLARAGRAAARLRRRTGSPSEDCQSYTPRTPQTQDWQSCGGLPVLYVTRASMPPRPPLVAVHVALELLGRGYLARGQVPSL